MAEQIVTPGPDWADPQAQLVLLKLHLRIDGDEQNDLIALHYEAAIGELDGPAGCLKRSLVPTIREALLDQIDTVQLLPLRPVAEILAVEERTGGSWVKIDFEAAGFELRGDHSLVQPSLLSGRERRVRYRAGYDQLPARILSLLLLMLEEKMFGAEPNRSRSIASQIRRLSLPGLA